MPTVPTITIPTTYWKLNSAGTILQTSGWDYGLEINGQWKGISVSDWNVDIQQGSLNTWMINDNQNHGLTIKSQTTINGDLNVSGQNAGITVNDWDIEVVHWHVNVAIGNLTMSNGNLTMSNGDININGQWKGISVSNWNVDIQQGWSLNTWKINDNQNHNLTIKSPTNITSGLTIEGKTLAKSGLTIKGKTLAEDWIEIYRTRSNYRPKILDISNDVNKVGIYDNVVIENQNTSSSQQYFSIIQLRPNTTTTDGSNIFECGSNPTNALNSIISCNGSTEWSIIYYRQRWCFTADDRYVWSFAWCVCDANFSNEPITQFCKWKTIIQN